MTPPPPITNDPQKDEQNIHRLPVLIHRAREVLAAHFRPVLSLHGLSDSQWRVLRIAQQHNGLDTNELAQRSFLLGPSLSRILKDLEKRDFLYRTPNKDDARRFHFFLSDQGRQFIEDFAPNFDPVYDDLLKRIGPRRVNTLNKLLSELLEVTGTLPDKD